MNRRFKSNKDKYSLSQEGNQVKQSSQPQITVSIVDSHSNQLEGNDENQYLVSPTFRKFPSLSFQNSEEQASFFSFGNPLCVSNTFAFEEAQNVQSFADGEEIVGGQTNISPNQRKEDKNAMKDKLKEVLKVTEGSKSLFETVKFSLKMVQQVFKTNRNSFEGIIEVVSKFYERKLISVKEEIQKKLQDARNENYINCQKWKAAENRCFTLEKQLSQIYFKYNEKRIENQLLNSKMQELAMKLEQASQENKKLTFDNSSRVTQHSNYNFHRNESFLTTSKCSSPQSYLNNIKKSFMSNTKNSENANFFQGCISEPKDCHFSEIQNVEIDTDSPSSSGKKSYKKDREYLGIKTGNKMKTTCLKSRYIEQEGYLNTESKEDRKQIKKQKRVPYRKYSEQTSGSGVMNNRDRMREKINKLSEDLQTQIDHLKTNTF